jgi:HEAT repeat protein
VLVASCDELPNSQTSAEASTTDRIERAIEPVNDESSIISVLNERLSSHDSAERAAALPDLAQLGGEEAFGLIAKAFDDTSVEVRNAAARALYDLKPDRAGSFTQALREGSQERRRRIGAALAGSGIAIDAINGLAGESREKTYDAFSILFLMAKAGEVQPLIQTIGNHPNIGVRLAVIKLLAFSDQPEIISSFRSLAVRGSLPSEVRSAVMEAIYQIGSQARQTDKSAA